MNDVKRYLLFAYSRYYPRGGIYDFEGSFWNIDEAKEYIEKNGLTGDYQHWQIVDALDMSIIESR